MNNQLVGQQINNKSFYIKYVEIYFIMTTFSYILAYYLSNGNQFAMLLFRFINFNTILLPTISIIYFFYNYSHINTYRLFFLVVFTSNIFLTIIYLTFGIGSTKSNIGIYLGILSAFCISKINLNTINKILKTIAILGCIMFVYIIFFMNINFDLEVALRRGYTWTEVFYYASFYWAVIPFVVLSFLYGKNIELCIVYWVCSLSLNLLFIKRFIIADSALLVIIILLITGFSNKKKVKIFLKMSIYIILIFAFLYFLFGQILTDLSNTVISRIQILEEEGLSNFDRFVESFNYYKNESFIGILIGKGFLGTHKGLGKEATVLHVGWSNFLFKGGISLLFVIIIPYLKMFTLLRKIKSLPIKIQFSIYIMIIYLFRLMYVNMHSFLPEMIMFFYCIFSIMDYKKSINLDKKIGKVR